jgi:hypothetical protein
MVHVLQTYPSTPMQPNQIFLNPNTMPVCAPQVFSLADYPYQNLFSPLFSCALSVLLNGIVELISGYIEANKFGQMLPYRSTCCSSKKKCRSTWPFRVVDHTKQTFTTTTSYFSMFFCQSVTCVPSVNLVDGFRISLALHA